MIGVGVEYLTLDRSARTLSGGESQRIRLATQIGTQLTGVLYVLDEPSIGLHPRDNDAAHRLAHPPARPRQLGARRGARPGDHGGRRLRGGHGARRGRARRRGGLRRAPGRACAPHRHRLAHDRLSDGHPPHPHAAGAPRRHRAGARAHRRHGPQPARRAVHAARSAPSLRDGRGGARQVDASSTRRSTRSSPTTSTGRSSCPSPTATSRAWRRPRQGHRHRPEPDRADAALQPGHLHGPLRAHPRPVRAADREQDPGLQAGAVLVQRQGRALRDVQGRRHDEAGDELPARRVRRRARRARGAATTPRRWRCATRARASPTCWR